MGKPHRGRRACWMKLKDAELLVAHMRHKDYTQARLARAAGCSRQFIHLLVTGGRRSCTQRVGSRIEEALDVPPGTLFLALKSHTARRTVASRATRSDAA